MHECHEVKAGAITYTPAMGSPTTVTKVVVKSDHSLVGPIDKITIHKIAPGAPVPLGDYMDRGSGNWLDYVDVYTTAGEFESLIAHLQDPTLVVILTVCHDGAVATYQSHTWYKRSAILLKALSFAKEAICALPNLVHEVRSAREDLSELVEVVKARREPLPRNDSDYPPPVVPIEHRSPAGVPKHSRM